jgi:hypothetical protein
MDGHFGLYAASARAWVDLNGWREARFAAALDETPHTPRTTAFVCRPDRH